MNVRKIIMLGLGFLLLSGCHSRNNEKNEVIDRAKEMNQSTVSSKEENSSSITSDSKESSSSISGEKQTINSSEEAQTLWNSEKSEQLQQFMTDWGTTMGQEYQEYGKGNSIKHYLFEVPDQILSGDYPFVVDNDYADFSWSEDGESGSGYKVVAVYSDLEPDSMTIGKHTYLFAFINDEPKVLIATLHGQHQAYSAAFKETENQDLKNGFAQIANNNQPKTIEKNDVSNLTIEYEEAKNLIIKAGLSFDDSPGHLVKDGEFEFTRGGNHVPTENGGILLRQYSGARGFEEYTVTPIENNQVQVIWVTSSIENGQRVNIEVVKNTVVTR